MSVSVGEIMLSVNRCFPGEEIPAEWEIAGGNVKPEGLLPPGVYVGIGKDSGVPGVYLVDESGRLPDDVTCSFSGDIVVLNPPKEFLALCKKISDWDDSSSLPGDITSEKFGEYSASYHQSESWQKKFAVELKMWRRMFRDQG